MGVQRSRRKFLADLAGGAVVLPAVLGSAGRQSRPESRNHTSDRFWEEIRREFAFREERVPMNAANLCPSPRIVAERV